MKHFNFAVLFVVSVSFAAAHGAEEVKTLAVGSPAPAFNLPGVDGKNHTLHEYDKAKILAVLFTCNHCPTAQAYDKRVLQLDADYKNKGVTLVAINPNDPNAVRLDEMGYTDLSDSLEEMKIRAKDQGFTFPYLYDGQTQSVSHAYGVQATPHIYIFDGERKLRYVGAIDELVHSLQKIRGRGWRKDDPLE